MHMRDRRDEEDFVVFKRTRRGFKLLLSVYQVMTLKSGRMVSAQNHV